MIIFFLMASLHKNIIYSSILTTANYIFPLLTYPYVSRVLGVANIGACNFADSIINYYILFSMLGTVTLGIREIAKAKEDRKKLDETFSKLFSINTVTTGISLAVLVISIFAVPELRENQELMWIGALKLISNYLVIDWLYKGLEEFKYITQRTIAVKMLYVVAVFLFIKSPEDTVLYYLLLTLMITGNALINILHSRKYVSFRFSLKSAGPFARSIMVLGVYALLTSMYTTFNVAFLGFTSGDVEVGYYVTSNKIHKIILSLFTAVTGVMLPRMSSILASRKYGEFKSLLKKSLILLLALFIPAATLMAVFAPFIIRLIAGPGYEGAILPLQIISPLLVIIGIEQIIIIQGLMPLGKDKAVLINSVAGAATGLALNIILVPKYGAVGSSIAWFASECAVLTSAVIFFRKAIKEIEYSNNPKTEAQ